MVRDMLLDVIKHSNVNDIDNIKLETTEDKTKIYAMDESSSIILSGKLNNAITEKSTNFAISQLNILKGFALLKNFASDNAEVKITNTNNPDNDPTEITFKDEKNQSASFRLTDPKLLPKQLQFKGVSWDVEITPENNKVDEFEKFSNVLSSYEDYFIVKTENDNLIFSIGEKNHKSFVIFSENVDGNKILGNMKWQTKKVLSILKLVKNKENAKIRFSNKGAMEIELKSDYGVYTYTMPGTKV